ncbi:unnamed protein product [Blepharisma stoltei]|uniref:Receptor ligand binding region domain-containing protein n=1 Tax=Blepharisma stoltei TaxID=1481888 RepID=A0AAU9JTH4_9CILI|nr:unnamed protein product [Blepharisma stoltei]
MKFWQIFIFITLGLSIDVFLVYDNATSLNMPLFKSNLESSWNKTSEFNALFTDYTIFTQILKENPENIQIVIDLTSDFKSHFWISRQALENHFIHITQKNYNEAYSDWSFSLNSDINVYSKAIKNVWDNLNWMTGVVFLSLKSLLIRDKVYTTLDNDFHYVIIESKSGITEVINRDVFKLGRNLYFVFTESDISEEIISNLVQTKLLGKGCGLFLSQESGYKAPIDGSLILASRGQEQTTSFQESLQANIVNLFISLLDFLQNNNFYIDSPTVLKNAFISLCENHFCTNSFSLVNIQSGKRVLIGDAYSKNFSSIIFPGGQISIPYVQKKKINMSISNGIHNPFTNLTMPYFQVQYFGVYIAIDQVNSGEDLISNFIMEPTTFDSGNSIYDFEFSYNSFSENIKKIGVMHIPQSFTPVVIGTMKTLSALNISIPVIAGLSNDASLSFSDTFPYFSRTTFDGTYVASQSLKLLYTLGWRNCAILYQDEIFMTSVYNEFVKTAKEYRFNILNREDLRLIPSSVKNYTSLLKYTHAMQEVIDSNAKLLIIVMTGSINHYIMDIFYDLGIRKGDFVVFWAITAWINSMYIPRGDNLTKSIEVSLPSISLDQPAFVGEIGKWVNIELTSKYQTENNIASCWSYDAARLGINALDYMTNRGLDYTNGSLFMSYIRKQNFVGCSGNIRIEPNSNNRFIDSLVLKNAIWDENSKNVILEEVGNWSPIGNKLLTMKKSIIYYGNSTNKPDDFRVVLDGCPFPQSAVKTFEKGRYLIFGIGIATVIWSFFNIFFIWKQWSQIVVPDLTSREEVSYEDFIMGSTIVIEFFQFLAMGPGMKPVSSFLNYIGNALSFDFDDFFSPKNGAFWIIIDLVFVGVLLWVVLSLVVLLNLGERKFYGKWIAEKLNSYADNLMPFLGNWCFIPFISILLDVFVCDQSIGDNFTDSFMMKDCYQFCWKDEHLVYSIFSGIAIILYEPLAISCRPLWQEMQNLAHVKSIPLHLMEKTIIQVIFIVLNKTIKRIQRLAHGLIFTIVMLCFAIFTLKYKAYNYERFSWWLSLSLFGVSWGSFLATIDNELGDGSFFWILLLIIGWSILICIGVIVQRVKYPSLLYRPQKINTEKLYHFAFAFSSRIDDYDEVGSVNFLQ